MTVLGVAIDFAGSAVDVSAPWLLGFTLFTLLLVAGSVYFNRSTNHDAYFVDEHWGDASIDDDEWALAIVDARDAVRTTLRELRDRSDARRP